MLTWCSCIIVNRLCVLEALPLASGRFIFFRQNGRTTQAHASELCIAVAASDVLLVSCGDSGCVVGRLNKETPEIHSRNQHQPAPWPVTIIVDQHT
jgi:hypothetical protein